MHEVTEFWSRQLRVTVSPQEVFPEAETMLVYKAFEISGRWFLMLNPETGWQERETL